MRIVGLAGPAGCGKDTVAEFLCTTQGFVQVAFADPIRVALKAMLGLRDEHFFDRVRKESNIQGIGKSPRHLMQTLGTEWGRNLVHSDLWVTLLGDKVDRLKNSPPYLHIKGIVISDIRKENEAAYVRAQGEIWHIHRTTISATGLASSTRQHSSEAGIQYQRGERIIHNAGSIDDLFDTVAQIFDEEQETLQTLERTTS